eukprot:1140644-Pelagomonas_calceolata.AAC.2
MGAQVPACRFSLVLERCRRTQQSKVPAQLCVQCGRDAAKGVFRKLGEVQASNSSPHIVPCTKCVPEVGCGPRSLCTQHHAEEEVQGRLFKLCAGRNDTHLTRGVYTVELAAAIAAAAAAAGFKVAATGGSGIGTAVGGAVRGHAHGGAAVHDLDGLEGGPLWVRVPATCPWPFAKWLVLPDASRCPPVHDTAFFHVNVSGQSLQESSSVHDAFCVCANACVCPPVHDTVNASEQRL